ncbi:helix-turn-helix domain-containing protein [Streptomyces sp. NPDC055400]
MYLNIGPGIALLAAQGMSGARIARRFGCTVPTARTWRECCHQRGDSVAGLFDGPRSGRMETCGPSRRAAKRPSSYCWSSLAPGASAVSHRSITS